MGKKLFFSFGMIFKHFKLKSRVLSGSSVQMFLIYLHSQNRRKAFLFPPVAQVLLTFGREADFWHCHHTLPWRLALWMQASWQLHFTAASWFCALTLSPLSYSSSHFFSLPSFSLTFTRSQDMVELNFAILTSLLTAVKSIFDNSLGFYMRKNRHTTCWALVCLLMEIRLIRALLIGTVCCLFFFFNSVAELGPFLANECETYW